MSYRPGADFDPGGGSEFFHIVQAGFFAGIEHQVAVAFRRAKVGKFIDIVHHSALAQEIQSDDATAERSDREPVGTGIAVHMIADLPTTASVHVLDHDGGIPGIYLRRKGTMDLTRLSPIPPGAVPAMIVMVFPWYSGV